MMTHSKYNLAFSCVLGSYIAANQTAQWPPRSPHEALLSTPGGRDRLRRLAERASPSPSPSKRSAATSRFRPRDLLKTDMGLDAEEDEEDEETLQLQLQEIQARLKLKKLQKKQKQSGSDSENDSRRDHGGTSRSQSVATSRTQSSLAARRDEMLDRPTLQNTVHVPVSPVRRAQPVLEQRSPGRVLLGIDKGLRAADISLKRAPSQKNRIGADKLAGPFLQRPDTRIGSRGTTPNLDEDQPNAPKSFSERMAALRSEEGVKEQRQIRVKNSRSQAFDIDEGRMQDFKSRALNIPDLPRPKRQFSRDEIINGYNSSGTVLTRSNTLPSLRSAPNETAIGASKASAAESRAKPSTRRTDEGEAIPKGPPAQVSESDAVSFEPYSARHLSKRIIPHQDLTRTLSGKRTYQISDILREVKGPDFSLPEIEEDIVIFGIIAKKSEPRAHAQPGKGGSSRGKYMVITLCDLKWELELFLFDSGFERFWKLTTGTIIAILNPGVMPPPRGKDATGRFSLVVNSEADTILEVGAARDLGFCKSTKKDGSTCNSWVDKRHTEFCDFHINETLKKTASKRMEINTMVGYGGGRKFNPQDVSGRLEAAKQKEKEKRTRWDRESHSQIFISKPSAANLLDNVDFDPDPFHRGSSKSERVMRQVLAQEKERNLAKKLGSMGGGLGADYMKKRTHDPSQPPEPSSHEAASSIPAPPDAAKLGLLSGKAEDISLGPIKRKRTTTLSSMVAMGWGSDLSKKLGSMKDGGSLQPVKKKTRFVTEKGIREAGRESFGGDLPGLDDVKKWNVLTEDDDDSDDLDIVR